MGGESICLPSAEKLRPLTRAHEVSLPMSSVQREILLPALLQDLWFCFASVAVARHLPVRVSDFCIMGLCRLGLLLAKIANVKKDSLAG